MEAKAAGRGHRAIAERWAARFRRCGAGCGRWLAGAGEGGFTALAASLVTDRRCRRPAGSPAADAVAAVAAAAVAAARVPGVGGVARWELAAAVTCGRLLAPAWPLVAGNASWLWAAAR